MLPFHLLFCGGLKEEMFGSQIPTVGWVQYHFNTFFFFFFFFFKQGLWLHYVQHEAVHRCDAV